MQKIDESQIKTPKIAVSEDALSQILLAIENDPYNIDRFFRIHIKGKGCDGFTYEAFFDQKRDDDIVIKLENQKLKILMSPFTAYYSGDIELEFVADFEQDIEGFVIRNKNQKLFSGKFWRENPDRTPTLI